MFITDAILSRRRRSISALPPSPLSSGKAFKLDVCSTSRREPRVETREVAAPSDEDYAHLPSVRCLVTQGTHVARWAPGQGLRLAFQRH